MKIKQLIFLISLLIFCFFNVEYIYSMDLDLEIQKLLLLNSKSELVKQLKNYKATSKINPDIFPDDIIYTYLNGKVENLEEFGKHYSRIIQNPENYPANRINKIKELLQTLNLIDINKNEFCITFLNDLNDKIYKKLKHRNSDVKIKHMNLVPVSEIFSDTIIRKAVASSDTEILEKYLDKFLKENSVKINNLNFGIIYTYLLGKLEKYREFSIRFARLKLQLKKVNKNEVTYYQSVLDKLEELDFNQNQVCSDFLIKMENKFTDLFSEKKEKSFLVKSESKLNVKEIFVEYFQTKKTVLNQVNKYDIDKIMKNKIENSFSDKTEYKLATTSRLRIEGTIIDFKIVNERVNENNEVVAKRIELLYNLAIRDNKAGAIVFQKKSMYDEFQYFTTAFSGELGRDLNDALDEFLEKVSDKIVETINEKIVELSESFQKRLVMLPEREKKIFSELFSLPTKILRAKFSGSLEIENEHIIVSGNLDSSGEEKDRLDKFVTRESLDGEMPFWRGKMAGSLRVKTTSYEKKADITNILGYYKDKNLELTGGNIFPKVTRLSFNSSIDGIMCKLKRKDNSMSVLTFLGRNGIEHEHIKFAKYNTGIVFNRKLFKRGTISFNTIYSDDYKNSISKDTELAPVRNLLFGTNFVFMINKRTKISAEFLNSHTAMNTYISENLIGDYGLDVKAMYKNKKNMTYLDYYWSGPDFYSVNGIATVDRQSFRIKNNTQINKIFSILTQGRIQHDNVDKSDTYTNYSHDYSMEFKFRPFKKINFEFFKNAMFTNKISYKKNYDKVENFDVAELTDNDYYGLSLKIYDTLFKSRTRGYVLYNFEKERNKITAENIYTRHFELSGSLGFKIYKDFIKFDGSGKLRYKSYDDIIDRYFNIAVALTYKLKRLYCSLDYYMDLNNTSVIEQDSERHKIGFQIEYGFGKKVKFNFMLKYHYDMNSYELSELDFNTGSFYTGGKFSF